MPTYPPIAHEPDISPEVVQFLKEDPLSKPTNPPPLFTPEMDTFST